MSEMTFSEYAETAIDALDALPFEQRVRVNQFNFAVMAAANYVEKGIERRKMIDGMIELAMLIGAEVPESAREYESNEADYWMDSASFLLVQLKIAMVLLASEAVGLGYEYRDVYNAALRHNGVADDSTLLPEDWAPAEDAEEQAETND